MTDTTAPAHARRRISAQPADLQPGDVLRDYGRDRTVATVGTDPTYPGFIVVSFDDGGDTLSIPAADPDVTVTAWRHE